MLAPLQAKATVVACHPKEASTDCRRPVLSNKTISVLKPLMTLRNQQASDEFYADGRWRGESPVSNEVERRFNQILSDHSKSGDEAIAYLLTVYMGEAPGEELVCEATNRGRKILPLIRRYSKCQPLVGAEPLNQYVGRPSTLPAQVIRAIEAGQKCGWEKR